MEPHTSSSDSVVTGTHFRWLLASRLKAMGFSIPKLLRLRPSQQDRRGVIPSSTLLSADTAFRPSSESAILPSHIADECRSTSRHPTSSKRTAASSPSEPMSQPPGRILDESPLADPSASGPDLCQASGAWNPHCPLGQSPNQEISSSPEERSSCPDRDPRLTGDQAAS